MLPTHGPTAKVLVLLLSLAGTSSSTRLIIRQVHGARAEAGILQVLLLPRTASTWVRRQQTLFPTDGAAVSLVGADSAARAAEWDSD